MLGIKAVELCKPRRLACRWQQGPNEVIDAATDPEVSIAWPHVGVQLSARGGELKDGVEGTDILAEVLGVTVLACVEVHQGCWGCRPRWEADLPTGAAGTEERSCQSVGNSPRSRHLQALA